MVSYLFGNTSCDRGYTHFEYTLSALVTSACFTPLNQITYIYFYLLPVGILDRRIITLDPDILNELSFKASVRLFLKIAKVKAHTSKTAFPHTTWNSETLVGLLAT